MSGAAHSDTGSPWAGRRTIVHSGVPNDERFHWVRTGFRRISTVLPAGLSIGAAIAELLRREKCSGGIIELSGGLLDPFRFVIPADDPRGEHPVWYSATRECAGGATIDKASCSVGLLEGEPFLHCHGLWRSADGTLLGGHLVPEENFIVEPVRATALLAEDAIYDRRLDGETGFELFSVAGGGAGAGVLATIRPNIDIAEAIESVAAAAGISEAGIHGVGSLIDMATADGNIVDSIALEVAITGGRIVMGAKGPEVVGLAMAGVGMDGRPTEGLLVRGSNRVCVTFELMLDAGPP